MWPADVVGLAERAAAAVGRVAVAGLVLAEFV